MGRGCNAPGEAGQVETGRGDAMDKLRSRINDLPDLVEEGAVIGGKVGATAAQGGDVQGAFTVEATNSAGKLAVGPVGKAHANSALGGLADKIPIKGSGGGASAGGAYPSPPASPATGSPRPTDPADVPLPPSPTTSTGSHSANDPADVPLPPSPTSPTSTHTANDPANVPLPPSPTTPTGAGDGPAPQRPETTSE
ncbi:hypothetical protein [Actinacidiphila sp. bgisy167]|uniref:hypothetical protein n=1 Tax=Actinacidiphila sp. bgisy167 TaxID=3413797 RepID=UPI003D719F05